MVENRVRYAVRRLLHSETILTLPKRERPRVTDTPTPAENSSETAEIGLLQRALRSAGSDAARYIPVRFVPALTSLLTVPIFTAAISPAQYGGFYVVSSAASLLAAIATGWISSATVRFYWPYEREGRTDAYVSTIVWSAVGALAATSAVVVAAAAFGLTSQSAEVQKLIPAGVAFLFFSFLTNVLVQLLRASKRASAFARMQVGGVVLSTALSIVLVWYGKMGAAGILGGAALGWAIMLIPIVREVSRVGSVSPRAFKRDTLNELATYGLPLVPVAVAGWALVLLDRYVLLWLSGETAVGIYSVAYSLGDKIMALATMPLLLTMAPSLTETFEKRGQKLAEQVQTHMVRYFALATFPLVAGLAVAGYAFMKVFADPRYLSAWPVLPLVAAGTMLSAFAQIAGTGLGLHKKTVAIMINTVIAAAVNFGLNVWLIPRFGFYAAAVNTLIAYGVLLLLTWYRSRPYMTLHLPWSALGRILAACAGMTLAVWLVFSRLVATATRLEMVWVLVGEAALGIVVYSALAIAFGAIDHRERAFAKELSAKAIAKLRRSDSKPKS